MPKSSVPLLNPLNQIWLTARRAYFLLFKPGYARILDNGGALRFSAKTLATLLTHFIYLPAMALALSGASVDFPSTLVTIQVSGDTFPTQVELSKWFAKTVAAQGNEGTCHIFAAVDLAEAYCNRVSGRLSRGQPAILLSEEYFTYRHIRTQLPTLLTMGAVVNNDDLIKTEVDAGYPENTLKRIFNGSILTEKEFSSNKDLEKTLAQFKSRTRDFASDAALKAAAATLDNYFLKKAAGNSVPTKISENGGYYATSKDPDIVSCVAAFPEIENRVFQTKLALQLLTSDTPFIWSGNFTFQDGRVASHAIVVDGYRFNPNLDPNVYTNKIEFHIRNSSEINDGWGFHPNPGSGQMIFLSPQDLTDISHATSFAI
jgi:hypothetical protein